MAELSMAAEQDGIAGQLAALARRRATGALLVRGEFGGIIHLCHGYLAFAESAVAPDLGSRLVNSRRLLIDQWKRADRDSRPDGCAGEILLSRGLIDPAEWETVVRSAAMDALIALAQQPAGGPPASPSFVRQQVRCGTMHLEAERAWSYARQEAGRLARHDVVPDASLRLRGMPRAWPRLGQQASAVLRQIDGRVTVGELAWRNGLALYGMMDWVVRLIQDGVCAVAGPPGHCVPRQWRPPASGLLERVLTGLRQLD